MNKVKNEIKENFTIIPNGLIQDKTLSAEAKALYILLASKPQEWVFYHSKLAKELGWSQNTLRKYMNELCKSGWVSKVGEERVSGKFVPSDYIIKGVKTTAVKKSQRKIYTGEPISYKEILSNKERDNTTPQKKVSSVSLSLEDLEKVLISPYFNNDSNFFFSLKKLNYFNAMLERLLAKKKKGFTPVQVVVEFYKQLKKLVEPYVSEKVWNRKFFSRNSKSAKDILDIAEGDLALALSLVYRAGGRLKSKKLDWTLETCVKRSPDLLIEMREEVGDYERKR